MNFKAEKLTRSYELRLEGKKEQIFPLLCPERELDWLPGWKYQMIYSKSGYNEEGCIFKTDDFYGEKVTWTTLKYDKRNYIVEFFNFSTDVFVLLFNISLVEETKNLEKWKVTQTYTSLSEKGNEFIKVITEDNFNKRMIFLEKTLNYYLKNKKMIDIGELK
jgi:hypothetical protein